MHPSSRILVLAAALLGSCVSSTSLQAGPARSQALVDAIERVHAEAERSRLAIAESFDRLQALARSDFSGNTVMQTYARFVQAIDAAEQQAQRLHAAIEPMQQAGPPMFEQWKVDNATIQGERLRQRGEQNLSVARARFDAIVAAAVPSLQGFDAYVRSLRDQATFLSHDLTAGALDDLQAEMKAVTGTARKLDHDLDVCVGAAAAYVEHTAAPAVPAPAPPPAKGR